MLFMQIMSTSSTYKALYTPWCHSILVGRVSLAKYLLILRVLFPLLQIMLCIMATARTTLLLQWMRNKTMGNGHSIFHRTLVLLVGDDYETGYVLNYMWCWCQTTLLSLLLNLVCNNYVNSDVCEIFVNCDVTCDWLCWIMYDLGLYVGWIKILHDTRQNTRFIWAQVWWFDRLSGCYCTCALINWTVLLQNWPQDALNLAAKSFAISSPMALRFPSSKRHMS